MAAERTSFTTEVLDDLSDAQRLNGCILYVSEGADTDQGRSVRLARGRLRVGSAPTCELVLSDKAVSREHAELSVEADGIAVRDLGSKNGTFHLGHRVEHVVLHAGARLKVGRTMIDVLPLTDGPGLPPVDTQRYGGLVGRSILMRRLFALLEKLENSDAPVLVRGETGTGKELVARALHEHGLRSDGPFVIVDCANLQPELTKSELFGHRRGAFTGAESDRVGAFQAADGGTLFLDEIGELPADLQPRLLRVLESGEVQRLGDTKHTRVKVRVIAATHRDLVQETRAGRFRQDLYYRLAVVELRTPALHERREDIALLAKHLTQDITGDPKAELPTEAVEFMQRYEWPGNVRELRNAVHRFLSLGMAGLAGGATTHAVAPQDVGPSVTADSSTEFLAARDRLLEQFEAAYLRDLVEQTGNNLSAASRRAQIDRKYLRGLLKKHGLYWGND